MLSARTSFAALTTEFASQTRRVYRGRAFRVRFRKPNARNGTQPEPRLRIILFTFETRHSVGAWNSWKKLIYFVDADTRRAVGAGNAAARDSAVGYHKRNICAEKYSASPHERQAAVIDISLFYRYI